MLGNSTVCGTEKQNYRMMSDRKHLYHARRRQLIIIMLDYLYRNMHRHVNKTTEM